MEAEVGITTFGLYDRFVPDVVVDLPLDDALPVSDGARRLWNESFFSAPQLKRDSLGSTTPSSSLPHESLGSNRLRRRANWSRNPHRQARARSWRKHRRNRGAGRVRCFPWSRHHRLRSTERGSRDGGSSQPA